MPGKTLTLSRRTFAIVLMDEALLLALLQRPFTKAAVKEGSKEGQTKKEGPEELEEVELHIGHFHKEEGLEVGYREILLGARIIERQMAANYDVFFIPLFANGG